MAIRSVPHVLFIAEVRGHLHSNRGKVAETALSCDGTQLHSQYHTSVVCEAHVDMNVISVQTCIAVDINKLLYIVLFAMVL